MCDCTLVTVPVELPQTIWLNVHVGGGGIRFLEVPRRILYLDPTTRRVFLLLRGQAKYVWVGNITVRRLFGLFVSVTLLGRRNGAPKDVRILGGNLLEIGDVEAEILSDNLKWGVDKPVGEHERGPSSVEVTVREY